MENPTDDITDDMFNRYKQKTFENVDEPKGAVKRDCIFYYFKVCKSDKTYDYEKTTKKKPNPGELFKEFLVRSSYNVKYEKLDVRNNSTLVIDDFYPVRMYIEETDKIQKYKFHKIPEKDIYVMYFTGLYTTNLICDIINNK